MTHDELLTALRAEKRRREGILTELSNLHARAQADGTTDGLEERIGNLNRGVAAADERIAELERDYGREALATTRADGGIGRPIGAATTDERLAYLDSLARAGYIDRPDEGTASTTTTATGGHYGPTNERRDAALRTIERWQDFLDAPAGDRLEQIVNRDEPGDLTRRYLTAVGDPSYRTAFGKLLVNPTSGHLKMTPDEHAALQRVNAVEAQRAMSIGVDAAGGFALPFTLDPSIRLSSNGALNPIRSLARVETITTNEWRGVTSEGVTATYVGEAAVATDGSPTLAQPVVTAAQWRVFVPFSIEVGQDFATLESELVRLVTDARDVNDSAMWYTGSGTAQPRGILTDLTASQVVHTSGATAFAVGDVWAWKQAIPARFIPQATFAAHPSTFDTIYRFVAAGDTDEPVQMPSRSGPLVGRPLAEWSSVGTQWTTSSGTIGVAGDFNEYLICDRLGITAELIPHLFSGNTVGAIGYPTGQRGLYCYGRTGAAVLVPNAFRALVVT
jgi:HK97 family phage major capsid protein